MDDLEMISTMLVGNFSNEQQYNKLSKEQQTSFPLAIHHNYFFNNNIVHLPESFEGKYIYEESYYSMNGKEKFKSDIFLFELNKFGNVTLKSIVVPKQWMNKKFNPDEEIDYADLAISNKFIPLDYSKVNDVFSGESDSMFTEKTRFILKQEISKESLIIKEEMYNGEKRIFGFDEPIVYKAI